MRTQKHDLKEKTTIQLENRVVVLTLEPFNGDVDQDEFTKIHYHNLVGEILTINVALNRAGNMLAEITEILSTKKLDFEIFEAQKKEEARKKLIRQVAVGAKGDTKIKDPTQDEVDTYIIRSPEYRVKKTDMIKIQKSWDIINSWYWAIKEKVGLLNKISDKLRPEDFEKDLIEEKLNGVMITMHEKAI